ncbi:CRISPR system Cascade subunit CasD [Oceanospirillum multiglobuliferum]|uniref:Type I-E CRISPR-associated protein Cas5/CasD n=1 Tax=Oceanospirillum multiglobuliferum TaxID=64969 RepID=A0A1T4MNS1_9GAMM|nr:type I-E CRISPR-associated protein Cas5/CasD [Oceanospirillum multiglobuliferum]OPX56959.1 type I-E CRISPR-associated protein Cas5/CasD [Oceanospirillum multiglobuliferum]SJZ68368.1 CRISPR system Cascade subunit CasD [Oceanospirillum multiglobuliferum]
MSEQNQYLLLWLEGPMQAWGHDSKFGVRDTLSFPTRSGVMGLLCCARGAGGPQTEWLEEMAVSEMEVRAYARTDRNGKPIMREPALRDFHMVGSGYDKNNPWQKLLIPRSADGKAHTAKITHRYYQQDTAFAVALKVTAEQALSLEEALQNPVWTLYLGRKNCVPTELIYQGVFDSAEALWSHSEQLAEQKQRVLSYRVVEQEADGEVLTLNDVPMQFGLNKRYRDRRVTLLEAINEEV